MKVKFSKAKHIWKNGKSATWIKADSFSEKVFSQLKQKYESIKYSRDNFLVIDGITLFLFYQEKKDFQGRPITEITALLLDKKIKNSEVVYKDIKNAISNIFDDVLEYNIEINDKYIVKDLLRKYLTVSLILLSAISLWFYISSDQVEKKIVTETSTVNTLSQQNQRAKEKVIDEIIELPSNNISEKYKQELPEIKEKKKKKWNWERFCKKYNIVKNPQLCHKIYIKQKCKEKSEFMISYLEYAKNHTGKGSCEEWEKLSDDNDLKVSNLKIKFFKGENTNEK